MTRDRAIFDRPLFILLLVWVVVLHFACGFSAGALWRDEANSVLHAGSPSWASLWDALRYDSFPALFPAILRLWSSFPPAAGDAGLRLLGLVIGLGVLFSSLGAARLLGLRTPIIVLVLFLADPILISEGDSIRPYGVSLIGLLWAFGFCGKYLSRPSAACLLAASAASVAAVQASYTNAVFVGCICLSAGLAAALSRQWKTCWLSFLPGIAAAVSLLPYRGILAQARQWASILHSIIDWASFASRYVGTHTLAAPIAWTLLFLYAVYVMLAHATKLDGIGRQKPVAARFILFAAVIGILAHLSFVYLAGIPPFPRYFLPSAMLAAFALESRLTGNRAPRRPLAAGLALILTAGPAWAWLRQAHTNADQVGSALSRRAHQEDLIVVSPWFLHTSFQRYYGGSVEWVTVPMLERQPMMRYDLIRERMSRTDDGEAFSRRIEEALTRGGSVWFVSQRRWSNLARIDPPEPWAAENEPRGSGYARFRSFWERFAEYRLQLRCRLAEVVPFEGTRVWDEEDLLLTRWTRKEK